MKFDDYIKIINKLNDIIRKIDGDISVTLGNDIFNHPRIGEIISFTKELMPSYYSYDNFFVPTTGIALINRKDRDLVIDVLKKAGCTGFMLTLHGGEEHHNEITNNNLSYCALLEIAKWLNSEHFKIRFNLMLSKYLITDWQSVCEVLGNFPEAERRLTVPLYLPAERMRGFQKYRADYDDCMALDGKLRKINIDEQSFFDAVNKNCEKSVFNELESAGRFDYAEENAGSQQWAFFNIVKNGDIFYGNAGLHTRCLGNAISGGADELLRKITAAPANFEWSAYYDIERLPPVKLLMKKIKPLRYNYVYSSKEDCVYSWFDAVGADTILLK